MSVAVEGIRQHLDYFNQLGVTALWFTPVLENDGQLVICGIGAQIYDIKNQTFHPLPVTGNCSDIQLGENGDLFIAITERGLCKMDTTSREVFIFPKSRLLDTYVIDLNDGNYTNETKMYRLMGNFYLRPKTDNAD